MAAAGRRYSNHASGPGAGSGLRLGRVHGCGIHRGPSCGLRWLLLGPGCMDLAFGAAWGIPLVVFTSNRTPPWRRAAVTAFQRGRATDRPASVGWLMRLRHGSATGFGRLLPGRCCRAARWLWPLVVLLGFVWPGLLDWAGVSAVLRGERGLAGRCGREAGDSKPAASCSATGLPCKPP